MRAYIVPDFNTPGMVAERPVPEPAEGQIRVRVKAAGVNAFDAVVLSGAYKDYMEHRLPLIPGNDYAGTVDALGPDVDGFAIGDEVFGTAGKMLVGEGSYAEYVTASAALAVRRPETVPPAQAAALPVAGGTALAEVEAASIADGDTVLIVGAAGGVGTFAVQLAALRGARVIALTSEANADTVRDLGADEVLDYAADNVLEQIRRLAPDGVAALIDNFHDAAGISRFAAVVRPGGLVISPLAMGGDQTLAGMPVTFQLVSAATDRVGELLELVEGGRLRVAVETYPLERAGEALARQATRRSTGKIVVLIG